MTNKMKTRKQFLEAVRMGMAGVAMGGNHANKFSGNVLQIEFAFAATITLGTVQEIGVTPHGKRRVIPITGGTFEGPAIKGAVEPGGADWQLVRTDNVAELDTQYTLKTEDGIFIYIKNEGYRHGPADVMQRLAKGKMVDPKEYYFMTTPVFETVSGKYDYPNKYIYLANGERKIDCVIIYKVL